MSNPRSRKCKVDFDYRQFNDKGIKVSIDRSRSSNMTDKASLLEEKKVHELQTFDDIQDVNDTHVLGEVDGLED